MIKPPFIAKSGLSGTWIEDGDGISACDINPLLNPEVAIVLATLLADGANLLYSQRENARENGKLSTGRPRKYCYVCQREGRPKVKIYSKAKDSGLCRECWHRQADAISAAM